jgi:hypothetical protein
MFRTTDRNGAQLYAPRRLGRRKRFVFRRVGPSVAVLALAAVACGGGGGGSSTTPSTSTAKPGTVAAIKLSLATSLTAGSQSVVRLTVQAINSSGALLTAAYASGVTIVSTDPNDVELSLSASGANPAPTVTITSATQLVYLVYDGNTLPAGSSLTAATTTASAADLSLTPSGSSTASAAPTSEPAPVSTSFLETLYVTGSGASPVNTAGGSIPIFIIAEDQNGNDITGTFPSPIGVSLTNGCDESLSIGGSGTVTACEDTGGVTSNITAIVVTSASQVVFVNYTGSAAASSSRQSDISISTSSVIAGPSPAPGASAAPTKVSIFCDAITFPYNLTEKCEAASGTTSPGPAPLPSPLAHLRRH